MGYKNIQRSRHYSHYTDDEATGYQRESPIHASTNPLAEHKAPVAWSNIDYYHAVCEILPFLRQSVLRSPIL